MKINIFPIVSSLHSQEVISNQTKELLEELGKQFGLIVDWSNSNVMPYLQDLSSRVVRYELITSICWAVVGIIIGIAGIILILRGFKRAVDKGAGFDAEMEVFIGAIMIFVAIVIVSFQIRDIK
jgi:hypothetical protein